MRIYPVLIAVIWIALVGSGYAGNDILTQVSTIDALMSGVYDGETTVAQLREKGDFGIGTFNGLDGEMLLLDGTVYKVTAAGTVEQPGLNAMIPFAAVTFFESDRKQPLVPGMDFAQFIAETDRSLPTPNIFYAIKVSGRFQTVKTRSVPKQEKPYRPLAEVVKTQPVFNLKNIRGTMVGFRCPSYVKGLNVPGYHLHFISADGKAGGHVLDFKVQKAIMEVDETRQFFLVLPSDTNFSQADLLSDREKELAAAESGRTAK